MISFGSLLICDLYTYVTLLQDSIIVSVFTFTSEFCIFTQFYAMGGLYSFQAERLPPSEKKIKNLILHYFIHTKMTEILKSDNSKFW